MPEENTFKPFEKSVITGVCYTPRQFCSYVDAGDPSVLEPVHLDYILGFGEARGRAFSYRLPGYNYLLTDYCKGPEVEGLENYDHNWAFYYNYLTDTYNYGKLSVFSEGLCGRKDAFTEVYDPPAIEIEEPESLSICFYSTGLPLFAVSINDEISILNHEESYVTFPGRSPQLWSTQEVRPALRHENRDTVCYYLRPESNGIFVRLYSEDFETEYQVVSGHTLNGLLTAKVNHEGRLELWGYSASRGWRFVTTPYPDVVRDGTAQEVGLVLTVEIELIENSPIADANFSFGLTGSMDLSFEED